MSNLQAKIQVMEKRAAGASALLRKAGQYDEAKHPRRPKGSGKNAGQFAPKGGGGESALAGGSPSDPPINRPYVTPQFQIYANGVPRYVFHSFQRGQFNADNFALRPFHFERGIFASPPLNDVSENYDNFEGNEYGDQTVALELNPHAKVYTASNQEDAINKYFAGAERKKMLRQVQDPDSRSDDQSADAKIAAALRADGFDLIHYTDGFGTGDEWAIISPRGVRGIYHRGDFPS